MKTCKNSHFYSHLVGSKGLLKFLKTYVFWRSFWKTKVKTLNFWMVKNIAKDFSDLKNWNCYFLFLIIRQFNNFSNKLSISGSYYKNVTLAESLKLLYSLTVKWRPFNFSQNLSKIIGWFFQLHRYQVLAFNNGFTTRRR